jgi:hypothetical protein
MLFKTLGICISMIFLAFQANADTVVSYNLSVLGGSEYQYTYSVFNDGSLGPNVSIGLFDVLFSPALYQSGSLVIVTPSPLSSQWDQNILASVGTNPAEYDVFALSGGIPSGQTVSGFAVQFQWIGPGLPSLPGAQPFTISDPISLKVIQSGETTPASASGSAPEPAAFWMIAMMGAIFLAGSRRVRAFAFSRRL